MYVNPIPYMLAHYSLFGSGLLLSYFVFKKKLIRTEISLSLGIFIAVLWHYPLFFNLGAIFLWIRMIEEVTLFLGGYMVGYSLNDLGKNYKILLLAMWMAGDTILSSMLMINPSVYTHIYSSTELKYLGIIMFLMMNLIAVYILLSYVNKMLSQEGDVVDKNYERNPYPKYEY